MRRSEFDIYEEEKKHSISFAIGGMYFGESGDFSRAGRIEVGAENNPIFDVEESESDSTEMLFGEEGKSPTPKL